MFASRGQTDRSRAADCVRTDRTKHFGGRGATMRSAVQPSVSPLLASRAVALATPVHVEPLRNNRTPCAGRASAPPMQKYCTELTEKLLKSLDKEYNVSSGKKARRAARPYVQTTTMLLSRSTRAPSVPVCSPPVRECASACTHTVAPRVHPHATKPTPTCRVSPRYATRKCPLPPPYTIFFLPHGH